MASLVTKELSSELIESIHKLNVWLTSAKEMVWVTSTLAFGKLSESANCSKFRLVVAF